MDYEIKSIKLDSKFLSNYKLMGNEKSDYLSPLGKLNIFVGTNNSGKSRLLRGLIMPEKILYYPTSFDYENIQSKAKEIKDKAESIFKSSDIIEIQPNGGISIPKILSSINPSMAFGEEPSLMSNLNTLFHSVKRLGENGVSSVTRTGTKPGAMYNDQNMLARELYNQVYSDYSSLSELKDASDLKSLAFERLYIPVIRGLRPPKEISGDIYETRTISDYFSDKEGNPAYSHIRVFCGLNTYQEIRKKLLGTLKDRELIRKYEKYLAEKFFEGKQVAIIPRDGQDVLTIKIGNEIEKEIYNVGDGLQTLIIITYPLFEHSEKSNSKMIACIEEPELLVHPGLQRTLMNELASSPRYRNIQFFITTHSNHFLDLTLDYSDISIFRIKKELEESDSNEISPKFIIENVSNRDKKTLELLGVRNSSVFLSNATIWVEGITDRMYIRHAFDIWQKSKKKQQDKRFFKEDNHYSFVEYGGSNLVHWDLIEDKNLPQMSVQSIVSNIFLIADNDKDSTNKNKTTKKDSHLQEIKKKLGDNFYRLKEAREIENLIPPEIIKKVAIEMGSGAVNKKLEHNKYRDERMGTFMDKTFNLKLSDNYGVIRNKTAFMNVVIRNTVNVNDLSEETMTICKKINSFIEKSN